MPRFRHRCVHVGVLSLRSRTTSLVTGGDNALSLKDLLDKHRHANAAYVLGSLETVTVLTHLLEAALLHGYRLADKDVRNTVLVVATQLALRPENRILFLETGCVHAFGAGSVASWCDGDQPPPPHTRVNTLY